MNFVPVSYPDYTPAAIFMRPGERQLFRVLNASAITYLNLAVLVNHIHQLHFMVLDYLGQPVNEPLLRDTVSVPYLTDRALNHPSVRLRMDFRDPNCVGTFVYLCHLLEHENKGMMGLIRVYP